MSNSNKLHELSFDEIHHALASIEIPSCPVLVTQVMSEAQKDAPDLAIVAKLISADIGMSAFTLKLANSPFFRRGEATNSVIQAIARLGTRNIVCVVVAAALRNSMSGGLPPEFLEKFWNRVSNIATTAGSIARKLRGISSDSAYTYALFHDAAIPVMMKRFSDYSSTLDEALRKNLPLSELESSRYRCTHAVVGGMLANSWLLPKNIVKAIRHHHDADIYNIELNIVTDDERTLIAIVHIAERLAAEMLGETEMEPSILFDHACSYLGLHEDDLNDLKDDLSEIIQ
jgi:HD-like signal output (HDOD) protein